MITNSRIFLQCELAGGNVIRRHQLLWICLSRFATACLKFVASRGFFFLSSSTVNESTILLDNVTLSSIASGAVIHATSSNAYNSRVLIQSSSFTNGSTPSAGCDLVSFSGTSVSDAVMYNTSIVSENCAWISTVSIAHFATVQFTRMVDSSIVLSHSL